MSLPCPDIFKACRTAAADHIFAHLALRHQLLQLAVDGRDAHRASAAAEMIMNLIDRHVLAFSAAQVLCQRVSVFGSVTHSAFYSHL